MRKIVTAFLAATLSLSFSDCTSSSMAHSGASTASSLSPQFRDNGRTMDSLKGVYQFEKVEYENWEEDDGTDSTLTVLFINSEKPPARGAEGDVDVFAGDFKKVASSIHRVLLHPNRYRSYYIIFVKREKLGATLRDSHRAGLNVRVTDL
jgi:hypothetical protein